MRTLLLVGTILLAVPAAAQESYTFDASASQVTELDEARITSNERTCTAAGLPVTCSQAELNDAGGSGTIYADSQAGREAFFVDNTVLPSFSDFPSDRRSWDNERARRNWEGKTRGQKNAICAILGRRDNCELF